jgi:hypothetical protein
VRKCNFMVIILQTDIITQHVMDKFTLYYSFHVWVFVCVGFCNVCVCVVFVNMWVCVCVSFVVFGCVYV